MSYHLIHEAISADTVKACEQLLEGARAGHVIGLGVVVMLKRRRFLVDCAGEALRDPVLMRGALRSLDEQLSDMVRGRRDTTTTI